MPEHELVVGDHPAVKRLTRALINGRTARLLHAGGILSGVIGALFCLHALRFRNDEAVVAWIWIGTVDALTVAVNALFFVKANRRVRCLVKAKVNLLSWFVAPTNNLSEHYFEQAEAALEEATK